MKFVSKLSEDAHNNKLFLYGINKVEMKFKSNVVKIIPEVNRTHISRLAKSNILKSKTSYGFFSCMTHIYLQFYMLPHYTISYTFLILDIKYIQYLTLTR